MAVDDTARLQMLAALKEVIGPEATATMSELLDPDEPDPSIVARFDQVDAAFRTVHQRLDGVDLGFDGLQERMDGGFRELRLEMQVMRGDLMVAFEQGLSRALISQTRIIVFTMIIAFASVAALAVGVA